MTAPAQAAPDAVADSVRAATLALCKRVPPVPVDVAAIAAAAGVAEDEVTARWPSAELVVLDAVKAEVAPALVFPDTGDFAADLRAQLTAIAGVFADPAIGPRLVMLAAAASRDPLLSRVFQQRVFTPNRMLSTRRFAAAVEAGQLRADLDLDTAVDLAFGPLWFRLLLGTAPVTGEYAAAVADLVLAGLRPNG
ncbi:MAG: hypothetical protein AVDCRST_MAG41-1940 [uncultured Corynebacteriales bacterium]|uniref:Tetracyclin repressor-like C-terminal domain-containing protein n=1 Tax=uncultured Mycobacteriales bacterium TaxID=581187 RepID=A0A6J4IJ98_9ACTN|nr:MAG: hypothetical protein AVDCRST_MAG41-1940 [uncultured Corynebacteriales bacterium]